MAVMVHTVAMPGVAVAAVVMRGLGTRAGASALNTFFLREIVHRSDCTRMRPATHTLDWVAGRSQLRERKVSETSRRIVRFALLRE